MTSPNIIIRNATKEDMSAVQAIYRYYVSETVITFEEEVPSVEEMVKRFETIKHHDMPYLVAEIDGEVVGYAYSGVFRTRPAYRFTCEHSIYLNAEKRGLGLGSKLMDALIKATEQTSIRQMVAVISDKIDGASVALHKKAGFNMVGSMPANGYKLGQWVDCTLMQRAIGDGAETKPDGAGLKLR